MPTPKRNEAVARYDMREFDHSIERYEDGSLVSYDDYAALQGEVSRLRAVVAAARRAMGDHNAPNDCYATGPLTGDQYRDLVECPACTFLAMLTNLEPPTDGR